ASTHSKEELQCPHCQWRLVLAELFRSADSRHHCDAMRPSQQPDGRLTQEIAARVQPPRYRRIADIRIRQHRSEKAARASDEPAHAACRTYQRVVTTRPARRDLRQRLRNLSTTR